MIDVAGRLTALPRCGVQPWVGLHVLGLPGVLLHGVGLRLPHLVRHEREVAVRRHKGHDPVRREPAEPHAGVEAVLLDQVAIAQAHADVRHAAEATVDLDGAVDGAGQHAPLSVQRGVDGLDHVQVYLVAGVLDVVGAPGQGQQLEGVMVGHQHALVPKHRGRHAVEQVGRRHQHLEPSRVRVDGYPAVQHLVQQLVQRHVVLLQHALGHLAKVRLEHRVQLREEFHHHQRLRLRLRRRDVRDLPARDVKDVLLAVGGDDIAVQVLLHALPVALEHLVAHRRGCHRRAPVLQRAQGLRLVVHDEQAPDAHSELRALAFFLERRVSQNDCEFYWSCRK
mmetsp:Transcript_14638/g.35356  ORF Transcript_14638/g.35356 Transcript_14638/m.35356 type:complete len:337 (-) Transcript_14638:185-1195(-)